MRRLSNLVLTWVVLTVGIAVARADEAAGYQQKLNERLSAVESLRADFRQFTSSRDNGFTREQTGQLWVEKPDRFRIITEAPWEQVLVSDGKSFWSYDADLEQVIVRELSRDIREVPVLLFGGDAAEITRSFHVGYFEEENRETFVLEPIKADGLFASLSIVFEDSVPAEIGIRDNLGQKTRIELMSPKINEDMAPSLFEFSAPEGVDVIDER